ncbi:MAG: universal stress protein [Pseudomonadota bacterium]
MIKSILIPTDGSSNSMIALDYGLYLASIFDAEISGLNVIDVRALEGPFLSDISASLGFSPYQNYLPKFQQILEDRSDLILEEFKKYCTEKSIHSKIKRHTGIISNIIAEEAKKVDLVIIAQRGEHEKWTTGLLGSTTESVVRKSPRPVLVTPNAFRPFENILIAYDGGIESNKALKTACEMFVNLKSNLTVVFVTSDEEHGSELTAEVEEFIAPYRMNIKIIGLQGDSGKEILGYAENNKMDLIVMGAFSHNRIYDLILGSTTAYIIRKTTLPILLNR